MRNRLVTRGPSAAPSDRDRALSTLAARAVDARSGGARLVTLYGRAGSGKTELLRRFRASDSCRRATVLYGACDEPGDYSGLRALFAERPAEPGGTGAAPPPGPAADALAGRPTTPGRGSGAPDGAAVQSVLRDLYRHAAALAWDRPLILLLDDVHRCDPLSLTWIDFLLRRADHLPVLVVLACRSEAEPAAPAVLADITTQRRPLPISLAPLDREEAADLVRDAFGQVGKDTFVDRVHAVSGGNPRTLTRLLGQLRAHGVRPDEAGERSAADMGRHVLARSVREVLERRPPWVADVARAVAVLGEEPAELLAALAGVPAATVREGLRVLRRAGVIAADRDDFAHDMVRASVLAGLDGVTAARLRTDAALLLSDAGRSSEELACQLLQLPVLDQPWMAGVLRDAAAHAERRAAPDRARRCLRRVLELEPESVAVRLELARLLAETDPPQSLRLLADALPLAADSGERARVAVLYGRVSIAAHRTADGLRVLDEVLAELDSAPANGSGPAEQELRHLAESTLLLVGTCDRTALAAARSRAERLTPPPGDTPAQRQTLATVSLLTALGGTDAAAVSAHARRAVRSAATATESWSLLAAAFGLTLADEVEEARCALDRLVQYGQDHATLAGRARALSLRSLLNHGIGAYPDALADAAAAVETINGQGWGSATILPRVALATVLVERGEQGRAQALLDGVDHDELGRSVVEYHWHLVARARVRAARGDLTGALELFLHCGRSMTELDVRNSVHLPWWVDASVLLATLDRHEEARGLAELGREQAERWGTARARGLARLALGVATTGPAGTAHLAAATELLAASPARAAEARAHHLLGQAHLYEGELRAAREHLRAAIDLAQRCGATALGATARKLLVSAGGRVRRPTASPPDLLTATERTVADLAGGGASNRAIAETLFVTVRTVETHLTSVYRKLGVAGRAELADGLRAVTAPGVRLLTPRTPRTTAHADTDG